MANSQSNDGSLMACGLIAEPSPPVQLPPRLVEEFLTATEGVATPGLIFGSREQGGQLRYLAHQVTIPVDPRYESLRWQPETQDHEGGTHIHLGYIFKHRDHRTPMLSSTECHLQWEAQLHRPYFFSVVCSAAANHNVCSLTAEGLVVIGGCQDAASVSGEMRPHAHYNSQRCPLPLRELQARARHVNESPGDGLANPLVDQRAAPDAPETGAISAIVANPLFKEAALVVLASPLHSHTKKAVFLQRLAAAKFPDQPLEITAAHVPYLMGQYQEGDYQPLFAAMSRSRGLSDQLVHWVHNFMDRECLYGTYAVDLCSGWGRN
jgi:hypothetical protein